MQVPESLLQGLLPAALPQVQHPRSRYSSKGPGAGPEAAHAAAPHAGNLSSWGEQFCQELQPPSLPNPMRPMCLRHHMIPSQVTTVLEKTLLHVSSSTLTGGHLLKWPRGCTGPIAWWQFQKELNRSGGCWMVRRQPGHSFRPLACLSCTP